MTRQRAMSWGHFDRIYRPIDSPDGGQAFVYRDTLAYDPHLVWSLMDGDNGDAYVTPGYHVVNVFGYVVTEVPWTEQDDIDNLHAKW